MGECCPQYPIVFRLTVMIGIPGEAELVTHCGHGKQHCNALAPQQVYQIPS